MDAGEQHPAVADGGRQVAVTQPRTHRALERAGLCVTGRGSAPVQHPASSRERGDRIAGTHIEIRDLADAALDA